VTYCGSADVVLVELARDTLERTGKYEVVEGVISPVSDSYPKKVRYSIFIWCLKIVPKCVY